MFYRKQGISWLAKEQLLISYVGQSENLLDVYTVGPCSPVLVFLMAGHGFNVSEDDRNTLMMDTVLSRMLWYCQYIYTSSLQKLLLPNNRNLIFHDEWLYKNK
jgi:hypothetical protein